MANKKHRFIVVDTETAPTANCKGCDPLNMRVYDIGWIVTDNDGVIYEQHSFIVRETFRNLDMMKSAYYAEKLPLYYSGLLTGEWVEESFLNIWKLFSDECRKYNVKYVWAYNARFDRDTLNSTLEDYSNGFRKVFLPFGCKFKDIMMYAKNKLTKTKRYAKWASLTGAINGQGKPSCSAENVYRYLTKNIGFVEAHTALQDCIIELSIYRACRSRKSKQPKPLGIMAWQGDNE